MNILPALIQRKIARQFIDGHGILSGAAFTAGLFFTYIESDMLLRDFRIALQKGKLENGSSQPLMISE